MGSCKSPVNVSIQHRVSLTVLCVPLVSSK